ncbi:hypothetical protein ABB07_38875 (plasmid) [Streptomyces incarnatus]|uniref:A-factor biosynthesis hotdog domain-containing protein n=1 Tax=Streptomyces incarnatus TaxID=665007 RepID=A0ABM5TXB0_9ACTN|nr:AfsA-related hotdog domain-containing protein [Streptomyces incarnatus]AKJ15785.1 hypothetical protein ABB07_38875 [Streptomyces incarnatus]
MSAITFQVERTSPHEAEGGAVASPSRRPSWPCAHGFFTRLQGWLHDPLILAETIRQVGSLLAHAEHEVAPASPQRVGRTSPSDVVLAGMVLVEAARQAAAAALERSCRVPLSMSSTFNRSVEPDECCLIAAAHQGLSPDGTTQSVLVTGRQNACEVFQCLVTAAACPR